MDVPLNSGVVDEAQEKLVGESNSSEAPKIEIKFDPKNGDTKIDISEVRQVFVGMGKEELMKFANDPFWVRMRWVLFLLFWVLWFAMLAGAIAIILLAPKCSAPEPKKYEESPIYHLNIKNFLDSNKDGIGDIRGMESKLDYFKDLGVGSVLLDPLMKTADGTDDVIDFKSINPQYGTLDDLKHLIRSAKEKGINILMKIIPNHSSNKHEWFIKSSAGEEPFKDYYVWTNGTLDDDGNHKPRNNWLSVGNGSAWTWDETRKQFYLHQFNSSQPDFNFRNNDVIKYFDEVYTFWLDQGLSGLFIDKGEYLVENSEFPDESPSSLPEKGLGDYDFLTHTHTTHLQESWDILSHWADVLKNKSAVLMVSGVSELKKADLIWRPINIDSSFKPADLSDMLSKRLNKTSQVWGFSCKDCNESVSVALQSVLLMLPGAVIFPSGVELGLPPHSVFQWNSQPPNYGFTNGTSWRHNRNDLSDRSFSTEKSNSSSFYNIFKKIIKERHSFVHYNVSPLIHPNSSVVAFTRTKSDSPHYLVVFNIEHVEQTINIKDVLGEIPSKITPLGGPSTKDGEISTTLVVPKSSAVIYEYIPKS